MDVKQIYACDGGDFSAYFEQLRQAGDRAAERKGEKPRNFTPPEMLIKSFLLQSRLRAKAVKHTDHIMTTQMPYSYPPCIEAADELETILIKDMRLHTRHSGCKVFFRVLTPPDRLNAVTAIVEDTEGLAVLLQLYQLPQENIIPAEEIVWKGRVGLIKEPFFKCTLNGDYSLRVDHVSDVVWMHEDDEELPRHWDAGEKSASITSLEIRNQGNEAVKKVQWAEAIRLYSQAVKFAATEEEAQLARLNRSLAKLRLGRFEEALLDASGDEESSLEMSLFRRARALYELRRYEEALTYLFRLSQHFPTNTACRRHIQLTVERIVETRQGKYAFSRMYEQTSRSNPLIDCATYSKPVEIRESPGRGRGLFTTRDVSVGELLLCEKAFAYCYAGEDTGTHKTTILMQSGNDIGYVGGQSHLITDLVQKLQHNPEFSRPFLNLHHGEYVPARVRQVDGRPVVDTFLVMNTVTANCFGAPKTSLRALSSKPPMKGAAHSTCGIWIIASHVNHSCVGNCRRSFIGDMMMIRAARNLPKGTELVFPYKSPAPFATYDEAQRGMKTWGFKCDCSVCVDKMNTPLEVLDNRLKLHFCLKRYLQPAMKPTMVHVNGAKSVLEEMEATYTTPVRSATGTDTGASVVITPRLAVGDPYFAVGDILLDLRKSNEAIGMFVKGFEALGYEITAPPARTGPNPDGPEDFEVKSWGVAHDCILAAFLSLYRAYRPKRPTIAATVKEYLITAFAINVGESESVVDTFPELKC